MLRGTALLAVFVDDERLIADAISLVLRRRVSGHNFYDGSAVVTAHGTAPIPDVVVNDLAMPKLNGFALAAWLEEHHPECRIVMVTGQAALLGKRADRGVHFTLLEKAGVVALKIAGRLSGYNSPYVSVLGRSTHVQFTDDRRSGGRDYSTAEEHPL